MKRLKPYALLVLPLLIIVVAARYAQISGSKRTVYRQPDMCEDSIEKVALSPDKKLRAMMIDRGCGVGSGQVTLVFLSKNLQENGKPAPTYDEDLVFEWEADDQPKIVWRSNSELLVVPAKSARTTSAARPFVRDDWNGAKVIFLDHS